MEAPEESARREEDEDRAWLAQEREASWGSLWWYAETLQVLDGLMNSSESRHYTTPELLLADHRLQIMTERHRDECRAQIEHPESWDDPEDVEFLRRVTRYRERLRAAMADNAARQQSAQDELGN